MFGIQPEFEKKRKKKRLYLTSCVIQSQQVLFSTHVDAHCKRMTKEQFRGESPEHEGGVRVKTEGRRRGSWSGSPSLPLCECVCECVLWSRQTSGLDYSNRCKTMQLEEEWWRQLGIQMHFSLCRKLFVDIKVIIYVQACAHASYLHNGQRLWAHTPQGRRHWHSSSEGRSSPLHRLRPRRILTLWYRFRWPWSRPYHHHRPQRSLMPRCPPRLTPSPLLPSASSPAAAVGRWSPHDGHQQRSRRAERRWESNWSCIFLPLPSSPLLSTNATTATGALLPGLVVKEFALQDWQNQQ